MSQTTKQNSWLGTLTKIYWPLFTKALGLTIRNPLAYVLFSIYFAIFYLGCFFYLSQDYIISLIFFAVFSFCASSIFAITGQIVKTGRFALGDFIESFKKFYLRTIFILGFWFAIFYIANTFLLTPISSIIKGPILLYLIIVPIKLMIFFVFNVLPEEIYSTEQNVEAIFIDSIKFMEKHWAVWIFPNVIIMFLLNLFDHRISIEPTIGYLDPVGIIAKLQDRAFFAGLLIFTIALIFRGLLYKELSGTSTSRVK